ncbi:restriction endonuclease subunit S [Vagococcus carniphilus]|uniref:restriction endonuclease subunit S n=1 Tax=Vagococcus carniphilus TaxID=218144 RepID=UPI0028927053|nr:restriction endonuclease subunit S [Vagococcus carniphilus]MDT2864165.1 restriction endonuclease subunit S [Vagococcus carniphilus]
MNNRKIPSLRFEGFSDDWEQRKAKNIFEHLSEKGRPDLPVLSVTQDRGVVYRKEVGIDIKYDDSTLMNYKVINPGDFIISLRSFQGGFELSNKLGITSPAYTVFIPKESGLHDNQYWRTKFKTFQFIESLKTVTFGIRDGKSISFSEFGDLKIFVPYLNEQAQIGKFFKKFDDAIALQERELDLLKEQKKGFLQKMFPKYNEKVPELRFEGFDDDWEQRKLGSMGKFNPKSELPEKFEYVDLESVVGTELVSHRTENKKSAPSRAQRLAEKGDLFYQTVRPYQKNNYLYNLPYDNYVFSTGYAQIRPESNGFFLLTLLQEEKFVNRVLVRSTGTSYPAINSKDLEKILITVPTEKEEQTKIGYFFKQLDKTITLQEQQLEKLKEMKKGFLQKMFV